MWKISNGDIIDWTNNFDSVFIIKFIQLDLNIKIIILLKLALLIEFLRIYFLKIQ